MGDRLPEWLTQLVDALTRDLRDLVLPELGAASARGLEGRAAGGDTTFSIDAVAERRVTRFLEERDVPVAFYSEDQGLIAPAGRSEYVLIVDPIDGTRPAAAGFEAACVSVAAARLPGASLDDRPPVMRDVEYGVVAEIKEGGVFRAARGGGVEYLGADGAARSVTPSDNLDLDRLFWALGFRGRPAVELVAVLGELIDRSSVDGAVFDLGSATYCMTRILTGQLDSFIDVGPEMIEAAPWAEDRFKEVGHGAVLNNAPYDVAASALIMLEAGCPVTDARGRSLEDRPLLGADVSYQMAVVSSASEELQRLVLDEVSAGLERFVAGRRAVSGPGS